MSHKIPELASGRPPRDIARTLEDAIIVLNILKGLRRIQRQEGEELPSVKVVARCGKRRSSVFVCMLQYEAFLNREVAKPLSSTLKILESPNIDAQGVESLAKLDES